VLLGEEAFFEEEELVFGSVRVVDDRNEEAAEVDLDAGKELGERVFFEVAVVVRGEGVARLEDARCKRSRKGLCSTRWARWEVPSGK
jgi:hypothetical protein